MDKFEKLYYKLLSLASDVSVYPMGGQKRAEDIKDTSEYRFGFNDGQDNILEGLYRLIDSADDEISPEEVLFYADDEWTFVRIDDRWHVLLNDTWYYACADLELLATEEYEEVARWYRLYGRAGVLYWVWKNKRDHLPLIPKNAEKIKAIASLVESS